MHRYRHNLWPRFAAMVIAGVLAVVAAGMTAATGNSLQAGVDRAMTGRDGALVVAEVGSGRILAAHRMDRASHQLVSPGSTLKPFVLMSLLEAGRLDPNQAFVCARALRIGSLQMDCTHPASVSLLKAEDAIAYSCNSYVAHAANKLSDRELVQALRRAGLDSPTLLVSDEAVGRIELPGNPDALELEALGERGVEVTPLELLEAYRKLALRKLAGQEGVDAAVFAGLAESVQYGMAHAAFVSGMKIAGKTGTASGRGSASTHGLFVGYAPAAQPEIVMVVLLEQGRGLDAADVAQPVLEEFSRSGPRP